MTVATPGLMTLANDSYFFLLLVAFHIRLAIPLNSIVRYENLRFH